MPEPGDRSGSGFGRNEVLNDTDASGYPRDPGEDRDYARAYDIRRETEYTNRPLTVTQLRESENAIAGAEEGDMAAHQSVQFFPSVGKFIIPRENTFAAHAQLTQDDREGLAFNPDKYVYFDKIIAEKFKNPALWDKNNPNYEKFEGLRTNLEVMRNDIIGIYLHDGAFNPGDEKYIPLITGIAGTLGDALSNDKLHKRPFLPWISVDVANVEGVGAREMYKHLLKLQDHKATTVGEVLASFIASDRARHWNLPALEETPYSENNLTAPPPTHPRISAGELAEMCAMQKPAAGAPGDYERLSGSAEFLLTVANGLSAPASLALPSREPKIEEARDTVRWLKNLSGVDQDMTSWLEQNSADKAQTLAHLTGMYAAQLKNAVARDPSILNDPHVKDANDAVGALALGVTDSAIDILPPLNPARARLDAMTTEPKHEWEIREWEPVSRLLDTVSLGLERTSGASVDERPLAARIADYGQRIQNNAAQLRSIDTLAPPAREESIELAREILRRLQQMKFSDKTLKELIEPGNTQDKAAFAQQLDTMVENYRNIVAEAAQSNPDIVKDQAVQEGAAAASTFAYGLKLMAAKEMPSSVAAAQQISASESQEPEAWKDLHQRTVGRLIKSMEGGLEKAVGEIQQQQDEQQQQQEGQAREAAAEAVSQSEGNSRRRKRRRRSRSGGGSAAKPKSEEAKRHREEPVTRMEKQASTLQVQGLKPEDLAAVKALGGNLRDMNNQARELAANPTTNPLSDDKSFAQRKKEEREQKGLGGLKI